MNPILYSIYRFLKLVTRTAFSIYYPNTAILHKDRLRFNRPTILVTNHPNTLMDPLNAGKEVPMVVHFLANAGLFKGRFQSWFFNTFFCIPIERPQDTKGRPINNRDSFARCDAFLGGGGCLYIAPEGVSDMGRRLRPIKTGTARIALSAEEKQNFELGLCIQPVGLTYDAPNYFHSRVLMCAGEPIRVKNYKEAYQKDKIATVRQLTADLEARMRSLLIDTRDEAEDQFIRKLETLLRTNIPIDEEAHFYRTKKLIKQVRIWQEKAPSDFARFQQQVNNYFEALKEKHTTDIVIAGRAPSQAFLVFRLILGFPFFFLGLLNNILPAGISVLITRKLNLYTGYNTTVKMLSGLLFFPLFYFLQSWIIALAIGTQLALLYLISLFPSGWFAWKWWQWLKTANATGGANRVREELNSMREALIQQLEHLVN